MGKVMTEVFMKADPAKKIFGYIPKIALASRGSMGSPHSSSFCERVMSEGNLSVTKGNTRLDSSEVEMLVVLRMNRDFMNFMRTHYADVPRQHFKMTIITPHENAEEVLSESDGE